MKLVGFDVESTLLSMKIYRKSFLCSLASSKVEICSEMDVFKSCYLTSCFWLNHLVGRVFLCSGSERHTYGIDQCRLY